MEQCSYTVIEMLMFGLPIIGTTTPGISEMIEDGVHGYKVKIRKRIDGTPFLKETEIVNALLNILACGQKERMAKNCRERYEKRYRLAYTFYLLILKVIIYEKTELNQVEWFE